MIRSCTYNDDSKSGKAPEEGQAKNTKEAKGVVA